MRTLIAAALLTTTPLAVAADTAANKLDGRWESLSCELRPQVGQDGAVAEWWVTRQIEIRDNRIEARFTTYGQPSCDFPLNELHFAGKVDVLGPSAVAETAVEADLTIDAFVNITPKAQPFADFLNSMPAGACGAEAWDVGTAQAIHETGCMLLGVEPGKPTIEYEILANIGGMLYFGARPVDGTFIDDPAKRPGALLVPLRPAE